MTRTRSVTAQKLSPTRTGQDVRLGQHRTRRRAAVLIAAALAASVVWLVSVPALGLDMRVGSGVAAQTVGPVMVLVVSLVAGGVAWGLLALLERLFRRSRLVWRILGWVFLALSLLGPASMATSASVLASLIVMHLAVGTTLILGLGFTPRPRTLGPYESNDRVDVR